MAESIPAKGAPLPQAVEEEGGASALERLSSFRVTYGAIFLFVLLYVVTIEASEVLLFRHFKAEVAEAMRVSPADGLVVPQIQRNVRRLVRRSAWTRLGEVRVSPFVVAADGSTIYAGVGGPVPPAPDEVDPVAAFMEAARLLPARAEVVVSVPHTSFFAIVVLVTYGSILLTGLFFYNRRVSRRQTELIAAAVSARDASARRAGEIERELGHVRRRLSEIEPTEQAHAEEILSLQRERESLQDKLGALADREAELRASAARAIELEQERHALEELLEEAVDDLGTKESEIQNLQSRLSNAAKTPQKSPRSRGVEQLAKRLRTLYKGLEIDDRAVSDMAALGDESLRLKAEEAIKRLCDEADNAAIRRKVGGLPAQLSIFELGFAGKGRIYYTRGRQKRQRVLAIGGKASQKTDLDYLRKIET